VKNGLVSEPSTVERQRSVVLCGDITPYRKLFSDSAYKAAGFTIIRCSEDQGVVLSLLQQLNVSILVARESFVAQLPYATVLQVANCGKGCCVLAIMDSTDTPSIVKMLRLGCRGVLPRQFSSKLFRRAVLAILRGELWAPRGIVSELLSELLRAASLKTDSGLTPQEARILELSTKGYKNSAIADALFISLETVRWHKRRLNRKLRGSEQPRFPQMKVSPPPRELAAG
jgi:DNA-binding NarL/FixJ family response regulator